MAFEDHEGLIDCRGVGNHGHHHAERIKDFRPICGYCYNNLLKQKRRADEAVRAARVDADELRRELEEAHRQVRQSALALGRIIEG